MPFNDTIGKLNDALFPTNPSKETANRLGVFGGESFGFAHGVDTMFAKNFYKDNAVGDQFAVAVGMTTPIPRSIFKSYALSSLFLDLTSSTITVSSESSSRSSESSLC